MRLPTVLATLVLAVCTATIIWVFREKPYASISSFVLEEYGSVASIAGFVLTSFASAKAYNVWQDHIRARTLPLDVAALSDYGSSLFAAWKEYDPDDMNVTALLPYIEATVTSGKRFGDMEVRRRCSKVKRYVSERRGVSLTKSELIELRADVVYISETLGKEFEERKLRNP